MTTNVEILRAAQESLRRQHESASKALKEFPRLASGLTPDDVRCTPEFRAAKAAYDGTFQALRNFNQRYAKLLQRAGRPRQAKS